MFQHYRKLALAGLAALTMTAAQAADTIKVGVSFSATGPAASLGIPSRQVMELLPDTLGGLPVQYIVLDDATDSSAAAKNGRRFVEQGVDAIIGSNTVPTSLALSAIAVETKTPQIGVSAAAPRPEHMEWAFSIPQTVDVMNTRLFADMKEKGIKRLAFIGFTGGYGDVWLQDIQARTEGEGIELVSSQRYERTDQSVTGQTLRMLSAKPDAVFIAASGTPGVLPMRELKARNYKGPIYQTHGMANNDVLRLAGQDANGMLLPTGALLVAEDLSDDHPSKKVALEFLALYEGKYGAGSRDNFAGYAYDAYLLLDKAAAEAVKTGAKPGTAEFRKAIRDAIETTEEFAVTHGVINMSPTRHAGFDQRAAVLITAEDGRWKALDK
jgi:branched-chain amino acid transport system substrate-binding protein